MRNHSDLERYHDVPLVLEAELGRCMLSIRQLLKLEVGMTLPLSRAVGEDLPIYVGGALIGSGEAIKLKGVVGIRIAAFTSAR